MNRLRISIVAFSVLLQVSSFVFTAQTTDSTKHPYASDKPLSEPAIFAEGVISTGDFESHVVPPSTSFWAELKRRNVPNAGEIAHAVVAWLIRLTKLRLPK